MFHNIFLESFLLMTPYKFPETNEKSKQNITRDIEIENTVTRARGEWGGDSEERGL